ncbi:uncharacterized protein LOC105441222 [Strongylocentrotus purpuratus]|uniref:Uncharacterized protein n=1 Tax=Strongylocentrotus purpuratus TaxID=7668 RepID=A0A7M7SU45_STRPU|nr:uncharacterized protein LOC105441222 [Strongylocentrotus purpuratus]
MSLSTEWASDMRFISNISLLLLFALSSILLADVTLATVTLPPFLSYSGTLAPGQDEHGGIPMGVSNAKCDDGKTNLTIDWDGSHDAFACTTERWNSNKASKITSSIDEHCSTKTDNPIHVCMHRAIVYHDVIPTSGAHRPLWAKYGEYRYLPKQRWLHNLEHGAAVFLYHPCADMSEVTRFRRIARGCLRKHIITPYKELTKERPFAVLTYGCKLELPYIVSNRIRDFLREHAGKAPERRVAEDGQFSVQQIHRAKTISNANDCMICPAEPFEGCPGHHTHAGRARQAINKAHHRSKNDKPRKRQGKIHD